MGHALGAEAEWRGVGIARLGRTSRPVDSASIETRRSAGLEAAAAQSQLLQRFAKKHCIRLTGTPRGILLLAAMNEAVEKSPGGDDDGLRADSAAVAEFDSQNPASGFRRSASGL